MPKHIPYRPHRDGQLPSAEKALTSIIDQIVFKRSQQRVGVPDKWDHLSGTLMGTKGTATGKALPLTALHTRYWLSVLKAGHDSLGNIQQFFVFPKSSNQLAPDRHRGVRRLK